jgi:hypothetical protein
LQQLQNTHCTKTHLRESDLHSEFTAQRSFIDRFRAETFQRSLAFPLSSVGFAAMASHWSFGSVGTYNIRLLTRLTLFKRMVPSDLQPYFWMAGHCHAYCSIVVFPDVIFWKRWDIILACSLAWHL